MLSYQHAYHAGNAADVHKHALLAWILDYLAQKPKPLTFIETHAGRALYDLSGPEALKTGEAVKGVARAAELFPSDHPYARVLAEVRRDHGANAYPGSPLVARTLLRPDDRLVLAERHPQEVAALRAALPGADVRAGDGPAMALSITPPTPRRGMLLVDPSYEIKSDFAEMPRLLAQIHRKWPVGVLMLWYPILASGAHEPLGDALEPSRYEKCARHEVRFPPARPGHGMIGSGIFIVNPPWGWNQAAAQVAGTLAP